MIEEAPNQERITDGMTRAECRGVIDRNMARTRAYVAALDQEYGLPPHMDGDWHKWPFCQMTWDARFELANRWATEDAAG
jgi:hypothetical protein